MSVENARRALRDYVERIVCDGGSPDGEALREALLGRPAAGAAERERLRARLLREAELWGPGAPEWRALAGGPDGSTTYAGRLFLLRTEVRVDRDGRVRDATVSLD